MHDETPIRFQGESLGPNTSVKGQLRVISSPDNIDEINEGDIVYIPSSTTTVENVSFFYSIVKAGGEAILTDHIGSTDHGVILANELGLPCIRGVPSDITKYTGKSVTVSGNTVYINGIGKSHEKSRTEPVIKSPPSDVTLMINLGFPEVVDRRSEIVDVVDGVGFMRLEFIMLDVLENVHPYMFIENNSMEEFAGRITERINKVVDAFAPKPVWIRTDDFSVSQLQKMKGGEQYEKQENYSMLGWRGIARSLDDSRLIEPQFKAIRRVMNTKDSNIGVFPPMMRFPEEYRSWKELARDSGLSEVNFGVMIETPSAALTFEEIASEVGFMIFGTNDLTQFTLAIDRGNERLQHKYAADQPAVLSLMERVITICNSHNIESSIGGSAGSDTTLAEKLLDYGISGFSVNPDKQTINKMTDFLTTRETTQY